MQPRELLERAFWAALAAADPAHALAPHFPDLPRGRLVVVALGKAAAAMAAAAEAHYPLSRLEGVALTPYGHGLPLQRLELLEAAHPVPDAAGLAAGERILKMAQSLGEDDLLLCLISGGGSALLSVPDGTSLGNKAALTEALLRSGADIREMNAVRKHLSRVKGGRLAEAALPAQVVSLILSDVVGDDLASVASGPTVPDPSTFAEALAVLTRYALDAHGARDRLEAGSRGELPETPKPGAAGFERVTNVLVGSNQQSLAAAAEVFGAAGVPAHILSDSVTGEAREAAKVHAAIVRQILRQGQPFTRPCALLSGGETTVTLRHQGGRGGRGSAFALALALELEGLPVYALSADTDGRDGSEDNAGAFVSPGALGRVGRTEAQRFLDEDDSYGFFERTGDLFVTGPTHTNVNDLRMVIIP